MGKKLLKYQETSVRGHRKSSKVQDCFYIALPAIIAIVIGIYIISTTVLIGEDGITYITLAKDISEKKLIYAIKHNMPFGYPFLIFLAHKVVQLFLQDGSIYSWIYPAQAVSLICRVLSLIPLYFIGKLLVGPRRSFWGLLILIMLPYMAEFGSDVIREWPHILFLSTGLFLLMYGTTRGKWWMFAIAGLAAGLGHTVRPECAQVVIYGILWLSIALIVPRAGINRLKAVFLMLFLLIGFAIPAAPYMKIRGRILPPKAEKFIDYTMGEESARIDKDGSSNITIYTAQSVPLSILNTVKVLIFGISNNMASFFIFPLFIGLYFYFRKLRNVLFNERFFIFLLTILYAITLVLLYLNYGYISKRHSMPIVVFTCFYVPVGLNLIAHWISKRCKKTHHKDRRQLFFILMAIGFGICLVKLVRITPMRWDKQSYLDAANWLRESTDNSDIIAVPDKRISFYAERKGLSCDKEIPQYANYLVEVYKDDKTENDYELPQQLRVFSTPAGEKNRISAAIYDIKGYISKSVSFVEYHIEKTGNEKYKVSFVFKTESAFEKDWIIYLHGVVKEKDVALLPEGRRKYKFDNWGFKPTPATSDWPKGEYITITTEIKAKPIYYDLTLGFFLPEVGRYGRKIRLGWVDFGSIQLTEGKD